MTAATGTDGMANTARATSAMLFRAPLALARPVAAQCRNGDCSVQSCRLSASRPSFVRGPLRRRFGLHRPRHDEDDQWHQRVEGAEVDELGEGAGDDDEGGECEHLPRS